jgi:hypothetical protein
LVIFKYVVVDFRHSAPNFRKIPDPETASHKHSIKDPIHVYEELSLSMACRHIGGVVLKLHLFLTLALDGG